jgi:hypothetical protein
VGARTAAARAEVVARRQILLDEVIGLEAAGRSAIDFPAKIRRAPAKTAALAAGTAFMVLGGPKRTYRAVRRAFLGPKANMPKSMLPEQVDKVLHALGDDGDRVRGVLEREFVDYLDKSKSVRESRDVRGTISELGGNLLRPATSEAGKRLAAELFRPEGGGFNDVMDRIKARRAGRSGSDAPASGSSSDAVSSDGTRGRRPIRTRKGPATS